MNKDKKDIMVRQLQADIPLVEEPFRFLARDVGCSEEEYLDEVNKWMEKGLLRRVGAVLRHRQAGYTANAMVAWKVRKDDCDRVGEILAAVPAVSHCYWRETPEEFPYPLFTMVHARDRESLYRIVREMAELAGVEEYQVIESLKELKKTSVTFVQP